MCMKGRDVNKTQVELIRSGQANKTGGRRTKRGTVNRIRPTEKNMWAGLGTPGVNHKEPSQRVECFQSGHDYSGDPSSVTQHMSICCSYGNRFTCCASPSCLKLASVAPSAWQAASASLKFIAYLPRGERRRKTPAVLAEHNNRYFHLRLLFRNTRSHDSERQSVWFVSVSDRKCFRVLR